MAGALLEVAGLSKRFGGFVALDGIDLADTQGERVGLIGPNGSGKSTFVNCICGTLTNETGTVRFNGEVVNGLLTHERTRRGMARSFQLPRPFATLTVATTCGSPCSTPSMRVLVPRCRRPRSMSAAPSCCSWSRSPTRRRSFRATSRRLRCASSSSRAPWRRTRSS